MNINILTWTAYIVYVLAIIPAFAWIYKMAFDSIFSKKKDGEDE